MDKKDVLERIKEDGVKFVSFQFTDVNGVVKSVDLPINQVPNALDNGIFFDGSSVEGFARIQESDMRLVIDPDTYAGSFATSITPTASLSMATPAVCSNAAWQP
jgi:glutamine synthetase